MRIPPGIASAAPQAPSAHGSTAGKNGEDSLSAGFEHALAAAGLSESPAFPRSALPLPQAGAASSGSGRAAKSSKQQPQSAKEKESPQTALAANVTAYAPAQPAAAAWPRMPAFAQGTRETGERTGGQKAAQADRDTATLPVEAKTEGDLQPAPERTADKNQPADAPEASPQPAAQSMVTAAAPATPNGTQPAAGDIAFAARVQPAAANAAPSGGPQHAIERESAASQEALTKKGADKNADPTPAVQPANGSAGASLMSSMQSGQQAYANAESGTPHAAAQPAPTPPAHAPEAKVFEAPAKPAAGPLKDISLQVAQPAGQKVEVRVMQQSGELRVAVRTGDSDLAHGLQQGLSDLVSRLQDNGFRAEAWRPGGTVAQPGMVFESRTSAGPQNGDRQSNGGGSQQQSQEERRQNSTARPAWVEELEHSIGSGQASETQGATYGIGA